MTSARDMDHLGEDIQKKPPSTRISLTRVGVTQLKHVIHLSGARSSTTYAVMDLFAHLDADRSGIHMSRFVENIEQIASEMSTESAPNIETLAERMALAIARTQGAARSEVRVRAPFPISKTTPSSHTKTQSIFTFVGTAISDGESTRRAVGVEIEGFTVCPCAREMVIEHSRELLKKNGYTAEQADHIVGLLPLASHNQRGRGTLIIGTEMNIRAEKLARIVEASMSSETYELLKRPDELAVVIKGHEEPRFVEDVVRSAVRNVAKELPELPRDSFIVVRQENFESIHSHNAYAEKCGFFGDLLRELDSGECCAPMSEHRILSLDAWMDSLL